MKAPRIARASLFSLLGALGASVVIAGVASAGPTLERIPEPGDLARVQPTGPLPLGKKLAAAKLVLRSAALTSLPPAQLELGPLAPRHPSGARISHAGPMNFTVVSAGAVYFLMPASGATGEVRLDLPTESNKAYLLDCRLAPVWGGAVTVTFKRGGAASAVQGDAGHYLYAFESSGGNQTVSLVAPSAIGFYGCEITKVN